MNPALLDWKFAFAVIAFTGAPYELAGVKPRRPRGDRLLLIVTALMPLSGCRLGWMEHKWVGVAISSVAIDVLRFEAHRKTPIGKGNREIATCVSLCLARRQTHMSARIQIWLDRHLATAAILFSDEECVVSAEPLVRGSMGRGAGVAEEDYVGINMGAGNPERLTVR